MSEKLENYPEHYQKSQPTVIDTNDSSFANSSLPTSQKTTIETETPFLPNSQPTTIEESNPFDTNDTKNEILTSDNSQKTTIESYNEPNNYQKEVPFLKYSQPTAIENSDSFDNIENEISLSTSSYSEKTSIEAYNESNNEETFPPSQKTVMENNIAFSHTQKYSESSSEKFIIEPENSNTQLSKKEYKRTQIIDPFLGKNCGENDRYQIIKLLGKGGMGQVYLALTERENNQHQLVAIKFLKKECLLADNKLEIERRFAREIKILISLNHPNIVKIIEQGIYRLTENNQVDNIPFYVMEYLNGESLTTYLERKNKLNLEEAMPLMIQILSGLNQAHQNSIIHRDLKPDNIFLVSLSNNRYIVKILDFGIARNFDNQSAIRLTTMADYFSTPYYISPEHINGIRELDTRSDIYTLGLIFYEILTGNKPFQADEEFLQKKGWLGVHNSQNPNQLISQPGCENLPITLNNIIIKCLEKSPDQRFTNAQELLEALSNLSAEISAQKTSKVPTSKPKIETKQKQLLPKLLLIGSGLILGIIIGIFIGILISSISERKNSQNSTMIQRGTGILPVQILPVH